MKIIAFFNNRRGVGKTTVVYHIAWMMAELGRRVLLADLDPQAGLTGMLLHDERLEELWPEKGDHQSILSGIAPILDGAGGTAAAPTVRILENLRLIPGDLGLSRCEDTLSDSWPRCLDNDPSAFRAVTAFYHVISTTAESCEAEIALIDMGPNLGSINRSALIAADAVVIPLSADLYSLHGLKNLGPTLGQWRRGWKRRVEQKPADLNVPLPSGDMIPLGYIIMRQFEKKIRPFGAFRRWVEKIPFAYHQAVFGRAPELLSSENPDPRRLGQIGHYASLTQMAREAGKPVFLLKPAEGAVGAHAQSVRKCYLNFKKVSQKILQEIESGVD